jgi:hypothetical protein
MPINPQPRQPPRPLYQPGPSRFIDQPCLALFDRGGMAARLQVTPLGPLNNLDAAVDWLDDHKVSLV